MKYLSGIVFTAIVCTFTISASAAEVTTNCCQCPPKTQLQAFEERVGTLIVKGTTELGNISGQGCTVLVACRESTDTSNGQKALGVAVVVRGDTSLVDYDELDSFLRALQQLCVTQWGATAMPQFDAVYTTKDGLRVGSFDNKATGTLDGAIQSAHTKATSYLTIAQLSTFRSLIEQAKAKLDGVRSGK